VCTAPIALSTAFTGVLFYDGASTAVMQVTRDNPTMRTCAALHGDDARVQAKIQSCVIPTWITGLAYWPLASVFMFRCNFVNAHLLRFGCCFNVIVHNASDYRTQVRFLASSCNSRRCFWRSVEHVRCAASRPRFSCVTLCAYTCRTAPMTTATT
jgi:hypothetical protein